MNSSNLDYSAALKNHLSDGWQMVSEGPSGAQLKKGKVMRTLDKIALVLGVVALLLFWPAGLVMIAVAVLDFVFFTKEQTMFLPR